MRPHIYHYILLIWNKTQFCLVSNLSRNVKHNLIMSDQILVLLESGVDFSACSKSCKYSNWNSCELTHFLTHENWHFQSWSDKDNSIYRCQKNFLDMTVYYDCLLHCLLHCLLNLFNVQEVSIKYSIKYSNIQIRCDANKRRMQLYWLEKNYFTCLRG